jgi:hypothetical protein
VKRPSPLETLKDLQKQAHERGRAALAAGIAAEKAAEVEEQRARRDLAAAQLAASSIRREEDERLRRGGITAAEGRLRLAWQSEALRTERELELGLARAAESRRHALREQELARAALAKAELALKAVEGRLEAGDRARRLDVERAQQEAMDESTSRRFMERSGT